MFTIESIVLGIVTGIITSGVLVLLSRIFSHIVLPWYQNILYSGIRVDGAWSSSDKGWAQTLELQLHQVANKITGTATLISEKQNGTHKYEGVRMFSVSGIIKDRFVELSFRHESLRRLGACNTLLEVVGDGRRMKGAFAFYSVVSNRIDAMILEIARREVGIQGAPIPQTMDLPLDMSALQESLISKRKKNNHQTDGPPPAMS